MSEQLALDLPLATPDYEPELTLAERYQRWIAVNPQVLDVFEAYIAHWLAAGHKRVSAKAVNERVRWESGIRTTGDVWRISNNWVAFIARDLIRRRPEWADAIETRVQRAAA